MLLSIKGLIAEKHFDIWKTTTFEAKTTWFCLYSALASFNTPGSSVTNVPKDITTTQNAPVSKRIVIWWNFLIGLISVVMNFLSSMWVQPVQLWEYDLQHRRRSVQVEKRKSSEEKSFKVPQPHEFLKMRPSSQVQKNKSCNIKVKDPVVFQHCNSFMALSISLSNIAKD